MRLHWHFLLEEKEVWQMIREQSIPRSLAIDSMLIPHEPLDAKRLLRLDDMGMTIPTQLYGIVLSHYKDPY